MDIASVAAFVSAAAAAAATSAAGEAGRRAWDSLIALVGRGALGDPDADPEPLDPEDEETVRRLTGQLTNRLPADDELAQALRQWATDHAAVLAAERGSVSNNVSGSAQVSGHVVQVSGDVHGGINLGGNPS